jgi:UDP-2,3-diacylglucosamine pyrophosphatase LpxH
MNAPILFRESARLRAVFISDTHLGSVHSHAGELADFLGQLRCERLYLVGDIVDLWWISRNRTAWGRDHNRVVEALHALRRAGSEIIYIPGNHDRPLRHMVGLALPRMQVRRRMIHTCADGKRLWVTHGDEFDAITHFGGFQEKLGDWLYGQILHGNRLTNAWRRRLGLRYWSMADFLKSKSRAAESYIERYVRACVDDARRRGLDGIVSGHIHRPTLTSVDGIVYANDGDWVESMTALAESQDGTLMLLRWRGGVETMTELAPRRRIAATVEVPLALPEAA